MSQEREKLNMLRRNTAFSCQPSFRLELPEPPSDAKLLIAPFQPEKLAKFALTSLERNPRRELTFEPGLGIHISMMDTSMYSVTDPDAKLDPEDLALLGSEGEEEYQEDVKSAEPKVAKGHQKVRERLRGNDAELSWLMRTSYINNEADIRRKPRAPRVEPAETPAPEVDLDEAHFQAVQESFEAAKKEPVHSKDPTLQAVEVNPVLPDFDRWGDDYIVMEFEGNPVADQPSLQKLPAHKRQQLADEAVAVMDDTRAADGTHNLAYFTPVGGADDSKQVDRDLPRPAVEGEYEWQRDFLCTVVPAEPSDEGKKAGDKPGKESDNKPSNKPSNKPGKKYNDTPGDNQDKPDDKPDRPPRHQPTILLRFDEGQCKYLELGDKLKIKKKTRSNQGGDVSKKLPRSSKVTVGMSDGMTSKEIRLQKKRLEVLEDK